MKAAKVFEVDAVMALAAHVESLSKKVDGFMTPRVAPVMACEACSGGHCSTDCPIISVSSRQVE